MKLGLVAVPLILMGITQTGLAATQGNFKRFSVSAGWLHVMPQGKANPFNINTAGLCCTNLFMTAYSAI